MAATAVVTLTVDESGSVAGLTRFEQAALKSFNATTKAITKIDTTLETLNATLASLGATGVRTGNQMATGFDKAKYHALTQLDTVRLLRDDLGVHIPRAMEKLISQWGAFQKVASVAFGGLAVAGSFELILGIVTNIGSKISEWANFLLGDGKAVQELRKHMTDLQDQILVSPKNIDESRANLASLKADIAKLEEKKNIGVVGRVVGDFLIDDKNMTEREKEMMKPWTDEDDALLTKRKEQVLELGKSTTEMQLRYNAQVRQSDMETSVAALEGYRKVAQEKKNAYADIQFRVDKRFTLPAGESLTPEQGEQLKRQADAKAAAELVVLNRQTANTISALWAQANAQRYQGEARAFFENEEAKRKFVEEETNKGTSSTQIVSGTAAMDSKYLAEKTERQRQFAEETKHINDAANEDALEGTARLYAAEASQLDQLTEERRTSGRMAEEFDQEYADRSAAIRARTAAEIRKSIAEFTRSEQDLSDQLHARGSQGFARIAAETQRRLDEEQRLYDKLRNGLNDTNDPGGAMRGQLNATHARKTTEINASGAQDATELAQKNATETQEIEERAASQRSGAHNEGLLGLIAMDRQQTARVQAEYDKQVAAWQKACDDQVLIGQQAVDRKKAIDDLYDAQMEEQQRALRDKLAGEIGSIFDNPMSALKNMMKHQMEQIIADWILQLHLFQPLMNRAMHGGTQPGGAGLSGGLGGLLGGFGGGAGRTPPFMGGNANISATGQYAQTGTVGGGGGYAGGYSGTSTGTVSPGSIGSDVLSLAQNFGVGARPQAVLPGSDGVNAQEGNDNALGGGTGSAYDALDPAGGGGGSSALSTAMGYASAGFGAYSGGKGVYDSFTKGGVNGAIGGAMSGVEMGASIGSIIPGLGTVVGGVIGGVAGLATSVAGDIFSGGNGFAARDYYRKTLFPQLEAIKTQYAQNGGDYLTAVSEANKDAKDGLQYMSDKYGKGGADWVNANYLQKELNAVTTAITRRGGYAQGMARSAGEFHDGGVIGGFGDFATSRTEGFSHLELGETIMDRHSSATHAPYLGAMRAGASPADIAGMYMSNLRGPASSAPPPRGGDSHSWTVSAIDAKSFGKMLDAYGADEIAKAQNKRTTRYAGDAP